MADIQEDMYTSPSFNSYSSNRLSEIAVKVAAEKNEDNNDDDYFEFSLVRDDKEFLAQENDQLGPIFPLFNRDLLRSNDGEFGASSENKLLESRNSVPLSKLFIEDRDIHDGDNPTSSSSSDADESENIPTGKYRVWRPKVAEQLSPSRCKKSKSTGSASKRWKFRDLLRRSNSERKDSLVFLTPKNREEKLPSEVPKKGKVKGVGGSGTGAVPSTRSAHEALYVRNRTIREGDKKKTYLPYRQDLVGFFVNVNVLSRNFPRF